MKCRDCKKEKAICLFPPSQMKKAHPICRTCWKVKQDQWKGRKPGAIKGRDIWSKTMMRHFV